MRTVLSILLWSYWTVCYIFCLLIILILFAFTWPFDRYRKIPNKALKLLAWMILKPIPTWRFNILGADSIKVNQPTIVMANHQSFLDIPLLYLLPWNMKWVVKKSMRKIPVLGWMISMTGHIPIDRSKMLSVRSIDGLIEPVKKGIPGMIFPEGTRSRDGNVQSLKRGAFRIAAQFDFQILPVVIKGGFKAMPPGSWKFRFHTTFVVSVLEPVKLSDFDDVKGLREYIQQSFKKELANVQAEDNA
jgi:1-acyl-sn-glycerol-3-phosphate acyltransferase